MSIQEITVKELNTDLFIKAQVDAISNAVGDGTAITALSGGVDSSVVTVLGHKALGLSLKTYFVENGIMRKGEAEMIVDIFRSLGIEVIVVDERERFFNALKGVTDPEQKREAITQAFYKDSFAELLRDCGARYLLQGTILTDVDETAAGIKRQHNVFEQIGIDPEKAFGYKILEPVIQLRKDGVRKVAQALGLPESIHARPPFPGPALAARVIGEVDRDEIDLVRKATVILEEELTDIGAFQFMAILHKDRVTGMRKGKRDFGRQIEVRCWDSIDAREASPTELPHATLVRLASRITSEVPGVVSVTYHIATKPPSTMEAV
jgi:GMP synthase (glutamine-hydrolysing)